MQLFHILTLRTIFTAVMMKEQITNSCLSNNECKNFNVNHNYYLFDYCILNIITVRTMAINGLIIFIHI